MFINDNPNFQKRIYEQKDLKRILDELDKDVDKRLNEQKRFFKNQRNRLYIEEETVDL